MTTKTLRGEKGARIIRTSTRPRPPKKDFPDFRGCICTDGRCYAPLWGLKFCATLPPLLVVLSLGWSLVQGTFLGFSLGVSVVVWGGEGGRCWAGAGWDGMGWATGSLVR